MMKVAITGSVASGKSSLARIWAREGVPVVSADELARAVVEPGTPGLEAVITAFGPGFLRDDGTLDRDALRDLVFRDPLSRRRLEEILHPLIGALRDEWMTREGGEGRPFVVAEIPLLFESGTEGEFDVIVFVDAPAVERLRRLTLLRGLEEEEARRIMDAQMPPEEKLPRSTFVIHNSGSEEELEVRALALLDLIRARAVGKGAR